MNAQETTLNIAVNLGRMSRWALEGKEKRIHQFLLETEEYVEQLSNLSKRARFQKTFEKFREKFDILKKDVCLDENWAEETLTWANILTHRAKLA